MEFSRSTLALDQERKRRQEEGERKKGRAASNSYNKILCRYLFACVISLIDLACMVLHVVIFCHGMGFFRCDSVFTLALQFVDNLDEMGSHTSVELDCQMDSKLSEVDLQNEKHMA